MDEVTVDASDWWLQALLSVQGLMWASAVLSWVTVVPGDGTQPNRGREEWEAGGHTFTAGEIGKPACG